jgi:hypothetical protein
MEHARATPLRVRARVCSALPQERAMDTRRAARRLALVAGMTASAATFSACDELFVATTNRGLDGTWVLTTINGTPTAAVRSGCPFGGYPIGSTGKCLTGGSLLMTRFDVDASAELGFVSAGYVEKNAQGAAAPSANYAGDYSWDEKSTVTLKAYGYAQKGTVNGDVMTVTGLDPVLFQTVTLVFQRCESEGCQQ